MRGSADVDEKVGSNGRLLPQAISVPDPLRPFKFLHSCRSRPWATRKCDHALMTPLIGHTAALYWSRPGAARWDVYGSSDAA